MAERGGCGVSWLYCRNNNTDIYMQVEKDIWGPWNAVHVDLSEENAVEIILGLENRDISRMKIEIPSATRGQLESGENHVIIHDIERP